jgi:hypothetical protein
MRTTRRMAALTASVAMFAAAGTASSAQATYHENLISEVHQGVGDAGDYLELQSYSAGQNLVGNHYVVSYDGGNNPFTTFQIPSSPANGANQATILIANDATVTGADFNAAGNLKIVNANGAACFLDTTVPIVALDCVDWGSSTGTLPSPAGTPVSLPAGTIPDNQSLQRNITRGCATALDLKDDTNNSAADFALGTASPRPNSVTPTEIPCPTPKAKKKCKKKKAKKKSDYASAAKKKKCKKKKKKK